MKWELQLQTKVGFILDNCCFCVELRTGSFIFGYLSLVGNIILTITAILGIAVSNAVILEGKDVDTQIAGTVVLVIFYILFLLFLVSLIFNIALLIGLHKYKRGHVKAYLICSLIYTVICTITFISKNLISPNAGKIVGELSTIVLIIYSLLVIRSYYHKMDDPAKRPVVYNTAL